MVDEVAEFAAQVAFRVVVNVPELIFNRYVARYFHGVGRYTLMGVTLGMLRIPSSLRMVPEGTKPRPTGRDWFALFVGIITWSAAVVALYAVCFGI